MSAPKKLAQLILEIEKLQIYIEERRAYLSNHDIDSIANTLEQALFHAKGGKIPVPEYNVTYDKDEVPTCQVLRDTVIAYRSKHKGKYPDDFYKQFLNYWSVPNEKGVPRWVEHKIAGGGRWSLAGRFVTWNRKYKAPAPAPANPAKVPDHLKMRVV